jgi:hypothetical protein
LRYDPWVEETGYVKVGVVELFKFDDGRNIVGVRQQNDLRFFGGDMRQGVAWWQREGLAGVDVRARDDLEILVEHDRSAQAAGCRLEGQELAELVRVLFKH